MKFIVNNIRNLFLLMGFLGAQLSTMVAHSSNEDAGPVRISNCHDFGSGAKVSGQAALSVNLAVKVCMDDVEFQGAIHSKKEVCVGLKKDLKAQEKINNSFAGKNDENGLPLIYSPEYRAAHFQRSVLFKKNQSLREKFKTLDCNSANRKVSPEECNQWIDAINASTSELNKMDENLRNLEASKKDQDPLYTEAVAQIANLKGEVDKCEADLAKHSQEVFDSMYDQIIISRSAPGTFKKSPEDPNSADYFPRSINIRFDTRKNQRVWFEDTQNPGSSNQYTRVSSYYFFPREKKPFVFETEKDGRIKTVLALGNGPDGGEQMVFDNQTGVLEEGGPFQELALGACPAGREATQKQITVLATNPQGKKVRTPLSITNCGAAVVYQGKSLAMDLHGVSTDPALTSDRVRIVSAEMECFVPTETLFDRIYSAGNSGKPKEARFKFGNDSDVYQIVEQSCKAPGSPAPAPTAAIKKQPRPA